MTQPTHPVRRRTAAVAVLVLVGSGAAAVGPPADASTIGVGPDRVIAGGSSTPAMAIASDGTIYAAAGDITVWSPTSEGRPVVVKTFTGTGTSGTPPALSPTAGLAYVDGSSAVQVLDPAQADGPAVPTRTITGALTGIDDPSAVTWTPEGSLWVADEVVDGEPGIELLRFAPGADGDVAPVQRIAGGRTRLETDAVLGGIVAVAGLPGDGVAAAPSGVDPRVSVFTRTQSGNVAPARRIQVPTPTPHWLTQGVAADPQGRIYIGSGDLDGHAFGRLDVYGPTADGSDAPLVTLGGTRQRFQIPLVPTVAANGRLALVDATVISLGSSTQVVGRVEVFRPLFTKPGAPSALVVTRGRTQVGFRWSAAANPAGTPLTYRVVVRKGARTVLSRTVPTTALSLRRSALPTGALRVTVTAVNIGGSGPGVTKAFRR
ncbi:hypothetical protein [Nocardioides sp.]|uniref:hypothetical protein n=1 Tax=Nocardioides sp. TaxID=35761 RepID=UPI00271CE728|nr:hypothetical protein [Nocardioides sp.]MDO9458488.1 hypothetical protein [Nocardioides sp.]